MPSVFSVVNSCIAAQSRQNGTHSRSKFFTDGVTSVNRWKASAQLSAYQLHGQPQLLRTSVPLCSLWLTFRVMIMVIEIQPLARPCREALSLSGRFWVACGPARWPCLWIFQVPKLPLK